MMKLLIRAVALAVLLAPAIAGADDVGAWIQTELRAPVYRASDGTRPFYLWRIYNEFRFSEERRGLYQAFLRTGPIFDLTAWVFIAVHGTVYADRLAEGRWDQEVRLELEPNLRWKLWRFSFNDRNRFEYRWRETSDRFRYRNQLRIQYDHPGVPVAPFLVDELLIDIAGQWVNENRLSGGIAVKFGRSSRIDLAYMWRTRLTADRGWLNEHIPLVTLVITPDSL